ncbi:MAG: hypothetical protein JW795_17985 [Chitinivibrionales bacterium]|nr:hypothetical protein [Chitinivibrionales bacterium]
MKTTNPSLILNANAIAMCAFLLTMMACDRIVENVTNIDSSLNVKDTQLIALERTLYPFSTRPRDTVFLTGTKTYTMTEAAAKNSGKDSLTMQIITLDDTILRGGMTLMGAASLGSDDIPTGHNWHRFMNHLGTDTSLDLVSRLIREQAGYPQIDSLVASYLVTKALSTGQQSMLITAVNKLTSRLDFYAVFHDRLYLNTLAAVVPLLERFVAEGVMKDTSGTLAKDTAALSPYEKEMLRWFNIEILVRHIDRPDENGVTIFAGKYPSAQRIYRISFTENPVTGNGHPFQTMRYVAVSRTGLNQVRFRFKNSVIETTAPAQSQQISPQPFVSGRQWPVTPLFAADMPIAPAEMIFNAIVNPRAYLKYEAAKSSDSATFFTLRCYYPLTGQMPQNGQSVRIIGVITVFFTFYELPGFQNPLNLANLDAITSAVDIETISENGSRTRYTEEKKLRVYKKESAFSDIPNKARGATTGLLW